MITTCKRAGEHQLTARHPQTECPVENPEGAARAEYGRRLTYLGELVAKLNAALGYGQVPDVPSWEQHTVTLGYIGNCSANGANDHRRWSVFLPHPGRVGYGYGRDQLGPSWPTGDLSGLLAATAAVQGALALTEHRAEFPRLGRATP